MFRAAAWVSSGVQTEGTVTTLVYLPVEVAEVQEGNPNAQTHFKSLLVLLYRYPIAKSESYGQIQAQGVWQYIPHTTRIWQGHIIPHKLDKVLC